MGPVDSFDTILAAPADARWVISVLNCVVVLHVRSTSEIDPWSL